MEDIEVESFLPKEYESYTKDTIVGAVRDGLDTEWGNRIKNLSAQ